MSRWLNGLHNYCDLVQNRWCAWLVDDLPESPRVIKRRLMADRRRDRGGSRAEAVCIDRAHAKWDRTTRKWWRLCRGPEGRIWTPPRRIWKRWLREATTLVRATHPVDIDYRDGRGAYYA